MTPEDLMTRIYSVEKRDKTLRARARPDSPDYDVVERNRLYLDSLWKRLGEQFHLSRDDYKKFINAQWLKLEGDEMMVDRSGRCLVNMRWLLEHDPIEEPIPCLTKNCFDCPDFDEATEEQELDYLHGLDV